ncbi:F0F1 ATP synthase subunit delta [Pseudorhodoferax sp.]|uniref:F0F1 ATP synthase subunit delta n=1 Tax=Pseudorhodoferax sp. TaxID=1993553 RepID=UPI002DD62375|nr:F0F1 ATP synthase subunit delta [Pseudorhodoferax sp.]
MAETATIARPYAEALFKAAAGADLSALTAQVGALATVAADPDLRQLADNPKVGAMQVFDLIAGVALQKGLSLDARIANLLRVVAENGRLSALPEIAAQFQGLVNADSGVSDATIYSAYAIDDGQFADVMASLEKRFARKLKGQVQIDPELIGGIRVVVGDEVLDTSVKARLEQMKAALVA